MSSTHLPWEKTWFERESRGVPVEPSWQHELEQQRGRVAPFMSLVTRFSYVRGRQQAHS